MQQKQATGGNRIQNLIAFTNANPGLYEEINFGFIPNFQAQEINQHSGIAVNGSLKILSSFAIDHIQKSHGAGTGQVARGQKTIIATDFSLIPEIISEYDSVCYGGKNSKHKDCVLFRKVINGFNYHVVMAHSTGRDKKTNRIESKLFVNTMYAKK